MTHLIHDVAMAGSAIAVARLEAILPADQDTHDRGREMLYEVVTSAVEAFVLQANLVARWSAASEN